MILTPLKERELFALEDECLRLVEQYVAEHPDCDDSWGDPSAGGTVPSEQDVRAAYRQHRLALPDAILERLSGCRSVLSIHQPGDLHSDKLQVSILRYFLERIGKGLVIFNDYPLELSDSVLSSLRKKRGAPGFNDLVAGPPKTRSVRRRKERPGEVRAARILQRLEASMQDADLAIDLKRAWASLPELAVRYAHLLLAEGVQDDAHAAKTLHVDAEDLDGAARKLEALVFEKIG
jgi:hypothetical protein